MTRGLTVGAVIANAARGAPDATAAVIGGEEHTFTDLDAAGTSVARQLVAEGLVPGDVALVIAPTSFATLAHFVGCARAGVVFAPLNPALDAATIQRVTTTVEPAIALVAPAFESVGSRIDAPSVWCAPNRSAGDPPLPRLDGHDPHIAFFTSGSTGTPKAALLSHQTSVLRSHPGSQLEPRGPALCPYPLFHMAGWTLGLQQWHARASVVFVDGTDAATLVDALRAHRIERFNAIPALWSRLAEHLDQRTGPGATLPDLRFADTGTSPTSTELLQTIRGLAPNAFVRVFYGSTEAGNVASLHHDDLLTRPGSCGRPSPLTEVAITDDGELLVAGPLLFDGYLGDPDATEAAIRHGWFHTGDRAEVDDDGYLSIVGRIGTVIRSGGESIAPETVEEALATHPAIEEVAVFGAPDDRWGEIVCAAIVASEKLTIADLRAHVGPDSAQPLAPHQHPRQVLRLEQIPRTPATGQIDRHRLRHLAEVQAAQEEPSPT